MSPLDFLRSGAPRGLTLGAAVTAGIAAMAAGPTESGGRAGGVYAYIPTNDAAACAIACAQDQICLAWSYQAAELVGCSLRAIVPPAKAEAGVETGIASRAAAFLALTSIAPPVAAAPEQTAPPPAAEPPRKASAEALTVPELEGGPIETATPEKIASATPFERVSAPASLALASLSWTTPAIAEPEMLAPFGASQFVSIAPPPTWSANPMPALQAVADARARIDEPQLVSSPAVTHFAGLQAPAKVSPRAMPAMTTLSARWTADLIETTLETAAPIRLAALTPPERVDARPLPARRDVISAQPATFAEPPPEPAYEAPATLTRVAMLTPARAVPPAPAPDAFLIAAPADAAFEEELLGGPETP